MNKRPFSSIFSSSWLARVPLVQGHSGSVLRGDPVVGTGAGIAVTAASKRGGEQRFQPGSATLAATAAPTLSPHG